MLLDHPVFSLRPFIRNAPHGTLCALECDEGGDDLLAYAMFLLAAVSLASLIVYLGLFVGTRQPRYLYLFSLGWLINGLAPILYYVSFHVPESLAPVLQGGFAAAQLVGPTLLIVGIFSHFSPVSAKRTGLVIVLGGVVIWIAYMFVPQAGVITIVLENLLLFGAVIFGLSRPQRFRQVGGASYYWLIAILVVGLGAAVFWLRYVGAPQTGPVVMPWFGTTLVNICIAFLCLSLEHADSMREVLARERELARYREGLETLVEERTAELQSANEAKSAFLAAMSHELRTPLNSVIGFSGILAQQPSGALTPEQLQQVQLISTAGRHLLELVEEILEFSKAEGGTLKLDAREFELPSLVESVVSMVRPSAEESGLELVVDIAVGCERMHSDPLRVQQLLLNLVGNAVKFTRSGRVSVEVSCQDPDALVFEISDTGIGMSAEELEHAFDDFYQAPQPDGMKHEGAGLGLTVSNRLATLLGGRIEATSTAGVGSVFRLTLPRTCPK